MKKFYAALIFSVIASTTNAQLSLVATAGPTPAASYTTLKDAFDAINAGTHQGTITISISGSTSEAASATLNASLSGSANYDTVIINTLAPATISGNFAGALVNLNGADKVTFQGNNQLTLYNSSTGGNTVTLQADATKNIIRNTTIKGATSSASSAVVFFGTGTTTGNDNNKIEGCNIDGTSLAFECFYSAGSTASVAIMNSGDTLRNNNFYDNNQTTGSTYGAYISGSTDWTITGNSFYQTVTRNSTVQGIFYGLVVIPAYTSDFHSITGNFVGGTAAGATGTLTLNSATVALGFIGMDIETGGAGNTISNNIVRNISVTWSLAGGSFANAGIFVFIGGYNGTTTVTGNTVSNITLNNTTGSALGQGIHANGRVTATASTVTPTFNITNNTISNITVSAGGTGSVQYMGIRMETSSAAGLSATAISNPLFNVTGNNINTISTSFTTGTTWIRGIMNINTAGTATSPLYPKINITGNAINNLTANSTLASITNPVVAGVYFSGFAVGTGNGDVQVVSQNTINNLNGSNTGDIATAVAGLYFSNGVYNVTRNKIYDLRNAASGATTIPFVTGINIRAATAASTFANNFITLGNGQTTNTQFAGIMNNFNATGPINFYFNSVLITGAGAGGNNKSTLAFLRGTEAFANTILTPMDLKDNLFINTRSGGGNHYGYGNTYTTSPTGVTSNYNDFYSSTPTNAVLWGATPMDLPTYQAASAQDANSKSVNVTFTDPNNGDLHLAGASLTDPNLRGTPAGGITTDYDGQGRSSTQPSMGGDEAAFVVPVTLSSFDARRAGNANDLRWYLSQELNLKDYIVERSGNGIDYLTIGKVTASGSANYQFTDLSPAKGVNYYRLKMIDINGLVRYSEIRIVKNDGAVMVNIFPNPVSDVARINVYTESAGKAGVSVIDINGKTLLSQSENVNAGNNQIGVDMRRFASGNYFIRVVLNSETLMQRISKQ